MKASRVYSVVERIVAIVVITYAVILIVANVAMENKRRKDAVAQQEVIQHIQGVSEQYMEERYGHRRIRSSH